jgi:hypothetical protein
LLIEIPLEDFRSELRPWSDVTWQELPIDSSWCVLNRFVGAYLVYAGCGRYEDDAGARNLLRVKEIGADRLTEIQLEDAPERLESLGDAVVVAGARSESSARGFPSGYRLSTLKLGPSPSIADSIVVDSRYSGGMRSHAFNLTRFRDGRIVAIPLNPVPSDEESGEFEAPTPTEIHYFGVHSDLALYRMGWLSQSETALGLDDACRASCDDWYGASRPFFVDARIFGLIDYELIEAEAIGERIFEVDRANAMPR